MENKNLGIILLIVIAIVIVGFVAFASMNTQENSKIKITSNKTLYENATLKVKLTDLNKTPITNGTINITIKDKKGKVKIKETIKTNSKGNAELKLNLKKGKYNVSAVFEGNDNYTGNNTTQKLTIKEKVKKAKKAKATSSSSTSYSTYSPQYGTYINQYTDSNGVQHIDGANGLRESYDPSTGILTTKDANGHVETTYMG